MRLVIERNGTFDVHECSAVRSVSVVGDVVEVSAVEEGGRQYRNLYKQRDAEAARRMARAIAVRCGVLVEALSEQPGVVTESVMFDGGEVITPPPNPRWEGAKRSEWVAGEPPMDDRLYVTRVEGTPCPQFISWNNGAFRDGDGRVWRCVAYLPQPIPEEATPELVKAAEWVAGEPPKDGRWYVVRYVAGSPGCVKWDGSKFRDWDDDAVHTGGMEYLPTPVSDGPVEVASQWVQGEPPKDGRWYVVALHREGSGYGMPPSLAAWYGGRWVRCDAEPETAVAWYLPTPVPGVPVS